MIEVYVNGVRQVPGIDFSLGDNSISFSSPPQSGASIQLVHNGYSIMNLQGNGSTFLFTGSFAGADHDDNLLETIHTAWKYRENPAVANALERLSVVVELVKENDTIYQR